MLLQIDDFFAKKKLIPERLIFAHSGNKLVATLIARMGVNCTLKRRSQKYLILTVDTTIKLPQSILFQNLYEVIKMKIQTS